VLRLIAVILDVAAGLAIIGWIGRLQHEETRTPCRRPSVDSTPPCAIYCRAAGGDLGFCWACGVGWTRRSHPDACSHCGARDYGHLRARWRGCDRPPLRLAPWWRCSAVGLCATSTWDL
jgi:hypothetical protein